MVTKDQLHSENINLKKEILDLKNVLLCKTKKEDTLKQKLRDMGEYLKNLREKLVLRTRMMSKAEDVYQESKNKHGWPDEEAKNGETIKSKLKCIETNMSIEIAAMEHSIVRDKKINFMKILELQPSQNDYGQDLLDYSLPPASPMNDNEEIDPPPSPID